MGEGVNNPKGLKVHQVQKTDQISLYLTWIPRLIKGEQRVSGFIVEFQSARFSYYDLKVLVLEILEQVRKVLE